MKATVTAFQSLADVEIVAEGLTVVVGKSNLGKSALVRAVSAALFNRAGDEFVRTGESSAVVTLQDLPSTGAPLTVRWEKGGGKNTFDVADQRYAKVGTGAPPPLPAAGYRDVKVGGETLRPQVAEQFDGLFLLDRPGTFVSDVLTVVSRLARLLKADRACGLDLKRQKTLLAVRIEDRDRAIEKLAALAPITALHDRVATLAPRMAEAQALTARVAQARALWVQRQRLLTLVGRKLPEPKVYPLDKVAHWAEKRWELTKLQRASEVAAERIFKAKGAATATSHEVELLEGQLDALRAELAICPVCDQEVPRAVTPSV